MRRLLSLLFILKILTPFSYCGKAVLAGGEVDPANAAIYGAFVDLATSSSGDQYIGVLTTANYWYEAEKVAIGIVKRLQIIYGAKRVEWLPFHMDNGNSCTDPNLASKIRQMTGIFFSGGETDYYLKCFFQSGQPNLALQIMQEMYRDDELAVMGSSAGTLILQSTPIVRVRDSWETLTYGPSYYKEGSFQFFEYGFIDIHFYKRANQGRLIRLVEDLHQYSYLGYGIDEDTAMVIDGTRMRIEGSRGVSIIDVGSATAGKDKQFSVKNIKISYLTKGDIYNFKTKEITWADYKVRLSSSMRDDVEAKMSTDIFSPGAFTDVAISLLRSSLSTSTYGYTVQNKPRYEVDFRKTSSARAYVGKYFDVEYFSFSYLYVDIYCTENC